MVADLHYALPQFDWVLSVAERYDVVVLAGDHIDLSAHVDPGAQTVVIGKYLELLRSKTRVLICSGNHDLDSRDASGEKVAQWLAPYRHDDIHTDWQSRDVGDTRFTVCAWWDGPLTQERLGRQLAADAVARPAHWFWVYHAPADSSPTSWTGSRHTGDAALLGWIKEHQPDMVFSGHIHQSPFTRDGSWVDRIGKTWVFNTGQHAGAPPAHIAFDTDLQQAVWISAAGMQSVALDQPLQRPLQKLAVPPDWITAPDRAPGRIPA